MDRRTVLLGIGTAAAGTGAVFGSGAFTQVQAERALTIRIDEDSDALLGITPGSDVASVYKDGSELAINTDELSADGEDQGFAVGSTVSIGGTDADGDVNTPAFTITNNFDKLDANTEDDSDGLDIALDLTNIDLSNSALTQLTFVGTPTSGTTQVTAAGERNVFTEVSANESIEFAIEFKTASTTNPSPLDSTITFQAGSDLTSDDFPTEDPGDPIRIADWNDLDAVRDNLTADYILANDLDKSTAGYPGSGFDPLGQFSGEFNGNGHTISDLDINGDGNYVGLFEIVAGTVRNLTISSPDVTNTDGTIGTGVLAGQIQGTAENITVADSIVNGGKSVGGITGLLNDGIVRNTSISGTGEIKGGNTDPNFGAYGGLIGTVYNGGRIEKCETSVTIKGIKGVGGIIGKAVTGSTSIIRSAATGDVEGTKRNYDGGTWPNGLTIGGLVGAGQSDDLTIKESYTTGTITGTEKVGGLVGEAPPTLTVERSYSKSDLTVTGEESVPAKVVGGLVGSGADVTINNSYAAISISDSSVQPKDLGQFGGVVGSQFDDDGVSASDTYWDDTPVDKAGGDELDRYWANYDGDASGDAKTPDATGLATSEIQGTAAESNMGGLDFIDVWQTNTDDYPTLR